MKAHETIRKATAALAESVASILDGSITENEQVEALAKTFAQAEGYLLDKFPNGEVRAGDFVKQLEYEGDLREAIKEAEALAKGEFDTKPHDRAISFDVGDHRMKFPNKRALAVWLAAQERIHKSNKEDSMTTPEQLEAARVEKLRSLNPVEIAKVLVHDQDARQISEAEFVDLISRHDPRDGETPAQTFARHYEANTQDAALLRAGLQVTKAAEAARYFDLQPQFVGGDAALNVDDPSEAIAQLTRIGRQKWPTASEAEAFERAFTDPANAKLAGKAYRTPAATSIYPMPK